MKYQQLCVLGLSLLLTSGCSDAPQDNGVANKTEAVAPGTGTQYLTSSEPAAVMEVADARKSAKADEAIAIVGRIGGSGEPFVDGVAAFTLVDLKIAHCSADEGCPTPWDYCCTQDQVKDNIATVKLVDAEGKPVTDDARKLLGVKELSVVVAEGTARRDESGNLTLAATKIFVRPVK